MKVELENAYVLHSRPFKDTSLLVDFFTEKFGRVTLVAKGARQQKKKGNFLLQPFVSLRISWQGKGQLKTLISTEITSHIISLNSGVADNATLHIYKNLEGNYLYSGFYVNELLTYLLPFDESNENIFYSYVNSIAALKNQFDLEKTLRLFEFSFLSELGYGVDFSATAMTSEPITLNKNYYYEPGEGFFDIDSLDESLKTNLLTNGNFFSGSIISAINKRDYNNKNVRRAAKYIGRKSLDHILMGKKIKSRDFFR
jgi:DNA repair protein RecO (recombination protein O)